MIARPGKIIRWGAVKILERSAASIAPHSGVGGVAPRPRKPSAAASRMTVAIPRVPRTTRGVRAFGMTLVTSTLQEEAPRAREAAT